MALPSSPPDPPHPPPPTSASATIAAVATVPSSHYLSSLSQQRDQLRPPTSPLPSSHHYHISPFYSSQPYSSSIVPRLHPPSTPIPSHLSPIPSILHDPTPPHPHPALLYPVASSGRGFLQKSIPPHHAVDLAGGFLPRSLVAAYPTSVRPYGFPPSDASQAQGQAVHLIRPAAQLHLGTSGAVMPGVVKGVPISAPQPTVANCPSISDCNGIKDSRTERTSDDAFATVRDRKVRISEATSLYALCRSWLRNGFQEEAQPGYMDGIKSLPRPFPVPREDASSPMKKEIQKDEEEDEGSVEHLLPQELLRRHVKRAKRVRANLREERLRRITRYERRLTLLLSPNIEQQYRNETAAGN